jgi:hypothetical protein
LPGALKVQLQRRPWLVDAAFTVVLTEPISR